MFEEWNPIISYVSRHKVKLSSVIINASRKTQKSLVKDMDDGKTIAFNPFVSKRRGPYNVAVSEINTEVKDVIKILFLDIL